MQKSQNDAAAPAAVSAAEWEPAAPRRPLTLRVKGGRLKRSAPPVADGHGQGSRRIPAAPAQNTNLRNVFRFFALMLVLTLVARGTAGAAMPVVTLQSPAGGTIVQGAEISGTVHRLGGQTLVLPAGLTVEKVSVQAGQALHEGDVIAAFSPEDIAAQLEQKNAELKKQQAALAEQTQAEPADPSAVEKAQTDLARANEDNDRAWAQQQTLVDNAQAQVNAAQEAQARAEQDLSVLLQQTDPPPATGETALAQENVESAKAAVTAAGQALDAARQAMDNAVLEASRTIENAQTTLGGAQADYEKDQAGAAITAQGKAAAAALTRLQIKALQKEIEQLTAFRQQNGALLSPRATTVLECSLVAGQKTDATGTVLRLTDATSQTFAAFDLTQEQAEQLTAGQSVAVVRGGATLDAAVQSIVYGGEAGSGGTARILAALPLEECAAWPLGQQLKIQITFSQTKYDCCLPAAAIRQDSTGHYVLAAVQKQTAFGITNTAIRVPVTVLEVSSDGSRAAVSGSLPENIITASDRTVKPGAAVRVQE